MTVGFSVTPTDPPRPNIPFTPSCKVELAFADVDNVVGGRSEGVTDACQDGGPLDVTTHIL